MGNIRLKKQSADSVPIPASDQLSLFVDSADSVLKTKDSSGAVRPSGVATADELGTAGDPVDVQGSAPPEIGQILVATSPTSAAWTSVAGGGLTPTAVVTGGSFDAAVGDLVPCNVTNDDVEVILPEVHSPGALVGVKMISAAGGSIIEVWPWSGSETIDGEEALFLDTDYEWAILISDGTNWMQIG